jgi:hypothetical protein
MSNRRNRRRETEAEPLISVTLERVEARALKHSAELAGTSKLGNGPAPIAGALTVTIENQLVPGTQGAITAETENTVGHVLTAKSAEIEPIKTSAAGCNPAWFEVIPVDAAAKALLEGTASFEVKTGKNKLNASFALRFLESGSDQSACEGQTVTAGLRVHAS